jgi:hypothetical protein
MTGRKNALAHELFKKLGELGFLGSCQAQIKSE